MQGDEENTLQTANTDIFTISSTEQEVENTRERKKSVAFNENVERLELERDEIQSTDL